MRRALAAAALLGCSPVALTGCSPALAPESPDGSVREAVARLATLKPVGTDPDAVAETFALDTRSTELQREALEKQLLGQPVQWPIKVYEVAQDGEAYKILSQPIPITDPSATPLLRVLAVVFPQSDQDRSAIASLRTGDTVAVKGFVRSITLRTVLTVHPAVLAGGPSRT
ncbi:MAG: hypothetical protein ACOYLF_14205 [Blastocatellia bacterium]